jgi:hypothetical protein
LVISAIIGYPSVSIGGGPDAFFVTDSKVSVGDPMTLARDPNVHIEPVLASAFIGHQISQAYMQSCAHPIAEEVWTE